MTELEARELKVGDMVLYIEEREYEQHKNLCLGSVTDLEGKVWGFDYGIVTKNCPDAELLFVDWIAGQSEGPASFDFNHAHALKLDLDFKFENEEKA
tara:strand:+ start:111 stop:401 length:291 start_codon:yes stop_codon:yes gene_type:complete